MHQNGFLYLFPGVFDPPDLCVQTIHAFQHFKGNLFIFFSRCGKLLQVCAASHEHHIEYAVWKRRRMILWNIRDFFASSLREKLWMSRPSIWMLPPRIGRNPSTASCNLNIFLLLLSVYSRDSLFRIRLASSLVRSYP